MTAIFAPPDTATQLARFSPTDTAIAELGKEYLPLHIADVSDRAGFELVHRARMNVRAKRCEVEKVRKELKADALKYGQEVDGEARRIKALLEPIESHLQAEEEKHEAEKEAIRNAARLKAEAEEKAKAEAEAARAKAEHDAEVERLRIEREALEAERAAIEAEQAKIDTARAEVEAERQRLADIEEARQREIETQRRAAAAAEQAKIDTARAEVEAERQRLADIEEARQREIETQRRAAAAAEQAKVDTENRIARQAAEAKAYAEAEEAARIKAEALRPDRVKLAAVASAVSAIEIPEVSEEAEKAAGDVTEVLSNAYVKITAIIADMAGLN